MSNNEKRLVEMLKTLTFIAETAAHMRGLELEILPTTDAARLLIGEVENDY